MSRPYPWTALIEALGEARLGAIRDAFTAAGKDAFDPDLFLLDGAAGLVLRDLVPGDAPVEAVTAYGALLHMLYLHWAASSPVRALDRAAVAALLARPPVTAAPADAPAVLYVQLPERLVWAAAVPGGPHEPLDGAWVAVRAGRLRVLAVLGFREGRFGFSTLEAVSPLPAPPPAPRADGTALFATVLPGGERMGYRSITSADELAQLALLALTEGVR